jgi:hypothetical protein
MVSVDLEISKLQQNTNPKIGIVKFNENGGKLLNENYTKAEQMSIMVNESEIQNEENKSSTARLLSYCTADVYPWKPGEPEIVHKPRESYVNKEKSSVNAVRLGQIQNSCLRGKAIASGLIVSMSIKHAHRSKKRGQDRQSKVTTN